MLILDKEYEGELSSGTRIEAILKCSFLKKSLWMNIAQALYLDTSYLIRQ